MLRVESGVWREANDPAQACRDAQMSPYAVGAAISRPQAAIRYRRIVMRKYSPVTVGDGVLDVPRGGTDVFPPRPGECVNRHGAAGRSGTPAPTGGTGLYRYAHISDAVTLRVDLGIDPYGA